MVFDPVFSYFYKLLILGKPIAELSLLPNITTTSINAVTSAVVAVAVYNALRPALKKAGLLPVIGTPSSDHTPNHKKSAA